MPNFVSDPLNDPLPPLDEEPSHPEYSQNLRDVLHMSDIQQLTITSILATDLSLGLRRIPAGFHVIVEADGAEWRSSNKPVHVDQVVVEWNEYIALPSESSSKVRISVYASFELGPMLGHGERLRTFEVSVGELLDRSEGSRPFVFQPKAGDVVSSCTSFFATVEQRMSYEDDAPGLFPIAPSTSCDTQTSRLMTDAGHCLLTRYYRMQDSRNLDQSLKHFERASELCPIDHPCYPAALFNLATAKLVSCQVNGTYLDLDIPISLFQDALDLRPTSHPDRPITQLHLSIALLSRFARRGFQTDADAAEGLLNEVLDVCHANSHVYRAALLAIETSALHPAGSIDGQDLGQGWPIASMLPWSLDELARRGELCLQRDDPHALDEVISHHYDALEYYSPMHAARGQLLCNLGAMLHTRFQRRGNSLGLDKGIGHLRPSLALHSASHPHRAVPLDSELSTRCSHQGNDQDLDEGIVLLREALALCPVGHALRSASLNNLAGGLFISFSHRGNHQDLDEAIMLHREALALRPVGHPDQSSSLNNLANGLCTRFSHRGNDQDLDEAIVLQREGMALCPIGHAFRSTSLNNLAGGLFNRFFHRGNDQDLDDAIVLLREALALRPVGHPDRSSSLNNLANGLSIHFKHRGNDQDLDEAIVLLREAMALLPIGHPYRSGSLDNLANGLFTRFKHRGNEQDLDEGIVLQREALAFRPVGHPDRSSSLNSLGNELSTRFEHRGNDQNLDEAIVLQREALALCPVGHLHRSMSLSNLADKLHTCFSHRGNDQDLDEAIVLDREAMALRPVGHPNRSESLNNLANGLCTRFEHRGNAQDLNDSLVHLRSALTLLTQHHPRQLIVNSSLSSVYLLFHRSALDFTGQDTDSLDAAMHHLKAAANSVSGNLRLRLRESLRWVHHAAQHAHGTELEAYSTSMHLLDVYMSATASVSSRHNAMKEFPRTLAVDAASCALRRGDVYHAVELLEQGRTLIWTQMARLRTPLDSLQERGDHAQALMKKFRHLSSLLDTPPANHSERTSRVDAEAESTRYRRRVEDWNAVVEEIRKVEGFGRFLLSPLFSDLQDAARDGPIIILIGSESSCDAIIIPHEQPPTSIQLPTNFDKLLKLVIAIRQNIDKEAGPKGTQPGLIKALREIWDDVVRPVVENLDRFARRPSRIWWCPTFLFNFLPLHAAGEYKRGGRSLSQLYVSSYTPSLTALIRARRSSDGSSSFAAIGQNHPPGHSHPLEAVEPELELVQSLLPRPPTVLFTKVTSVESTKSRVLHTLQDHHWLHFACHGRQDLLEPFKSAFLMRDQPLSLLDITQTNMSRHEFAFLSACETAVGDIQTPDEAIHLAAGLQFSGVKSVVGTLWNVDDSTVRRLVEAFYKNFCGNGKMDSRRAARALHRAVQMLACDKDMPLDQRIVFMHIGI
ncbi:CHAT domain-containing protein [Suillus ampliporus]|nr:CHAT domain-containing protein [Suillus ampliporus]